MIAWTTEGIEINLGTSISLKETGIGEIAVRLLDALKAPLPTKAHSSAKAYI